MIKPEVGKTYLRIGGFKDHSYHPYYHKNSHITIVKADKNMIYFLINNKRVRELFPENSEEYFMASPNELALDSKVFIPITKLSKVLFT